MAKKVLLIVEGEADEVRFFKYLFKNCYPSTHYQFVTYRANIHVLAQELFLNYSSFDIDEIDIKLVLASLERDEGKKEILRAEYTDIYLVFDFDPQHDHTHFDTVRRMLSYFSDSTAQGKLYINYPMMQSYKHFSDLPDPGFATREVDYSEIRDYKRIVGDTSRFTDLSRYDYKTFYSIAAHHLMKVNLLVNGRYVLPSWEEYLTLDLLALYDYQYNLFAKTGKTAVVNTCIFVLCDFAPKKCFRFLENKRDELLF